MTFIGKLLVFLNIQLALALLAWSVSLYTNRVDWPAVQDGDKTLVAWVPEYAKGVADRNRAYFDARLAAQSAETQLAQREAALDAKLAEARQKDGQFFELLRKPAKGELLPADRYDLKSATRTTVTRRDGSTVPLSGMDAVQKQLRDAVDDTFKEKARFAAARMKQGEADLAVAKANSDIGRYRLALAQRDDEKRYLDDNRINWDAQLITLQKRNDQLWDRLKVFGVNRAAAAPPASLVAAPR